MTEFSAIVDESFAPDFVFHDPNIPLPAGGIRSREDYKQFVTRWRDRPFISENTCYKKAS